MTANTATATTVYAVVVVKGETVFLPVAAKGARVAATVEIAGGTVIARQSFTTREVARRAAWRANRGGRMVISADTITAEAHAFYLAFAQANHGKIRFDDMFRDAMKAYAGR
jgi:hypothetical protein